MEVIKVGMADLKITAAPHLLKTMGLGSCVGVALYDPAKSIAGLAHVMLPDSHISREEKANKAKYADTAIPLLIQLMEEQGASVQKLFAKLAGGAQMFAFSSSTQDHLRIGPRNVEACKNILHGYGIPIISEVTGGNNGRTIELDSKTGMLMIRSANQGVKEI